MVEINNESRGKHTDNQIRFKTSMLRSSLYDYSDAYILVKKTIMFAEATVAAPNNTNKKVKFENFAPFTKCINTITNMQVDDAQHIDVVMPMYNLIEYSDNYLKTSGNLRQFYRDVPAVDDNSEIVDFNVGNATTRLFNLKVKLAGQAANDGTKDVEIMVPLKYLSNF